MHYAICNIHPFSPYPDPGTTTTQCIMRIMNYNNMHYENFDCSFLPEFLGTYAFQVLSPHVPPHSLHRYRTAGTGPQGSQKILINRRSSDRRFCDWTCVGSGRTLGFQIRVRMCLWPAQKDGDSTQSETHFLT